MELSSIPSTSFRWFILTLEIFRLIVLLPPGPARPFNYPDQGDQVYLDPGLLLNQEEAAQAQAEQGDNVIVAVVNPPAAGDLAAVINPPAPGDLAAVNPPAPGDPAAVVNPPAAGELQPQDSPTSNVIAEFREDMTTIREDMTTIRGDMTAIREDMTAIRGTLQRIERRLGRSCNIL